MSDPIVATEHGAVQGTHAEGVTRFLGIPYPATRPTLLFDVETRIEHAPADAERAVVAAQGANPNI